MKTMNFFHNAKIKIPFYPQFVFECIVFMQQIFKKRLLTFVNVKKLVKNTDFFKYIVKTEDFFLQIFLVYSIKFVVERTLFSAIYTKLSSIISEIFDKIRFTLPVFRGRFYSFNIDDKNDSINKND